MSQADKVGRRFDHDLARHFKVGEAMSAGYLNGENFIEPEAVGVDAHPAKCRGADKDHAK